MQEPPLPDWVLALDAALGASAGIPSARYAQLATTRADGRPANRTVVVRGRLDPGACILITTDARSAKVGQLGASPWAELCWYFAETREQFRIAGRVAIVGPVGEEGLGEARQRVWAGLPDASKRSFAGPPPGSPRAGPEAFAAGTPVEPPSAFRLLVLEPEAVDHLDLREEPHRRAIHRREGDVWVSRRVNP